MGRNIPQKTAGQIIRELDEFSQGKLLKKDDLERIIDISFRKNKIKLLEGAAFTAKFLKGLFSIIQRGESSIDENVLKRYIKEYSENIEKLKSYLKEIIKGEGAFIGSIYEEKYLSLSQEALTNLTELCNDLSWYKIYLNEQKKSR